MSNTLKCNVCHIVIDELLAYIQNKIPIADEVTLVQICSSAFSCEQIEKANSLLLESLPSDVRITIRKGKGTENRLLYDNINVFKITEPDVLPIFVARDLKKLPPIERSDLEDIKREYLSRKVVSPPFSAAKINMKWGGCLDSGPIGLSYLEDIVTNNDYLNYRDLNINNLEGSQIKTRRNAFQQSPERYDDNTGRSLKQNCRRE
ncbi:mutant cadherin [Danaus plexippus plexippus]|uniref:Mutant cadherin n=1 Tax=Danaus plexippus plexippus TaxID=278856 RepID=A0A212EX20_DANPL|nr:mutant cadherin [Danaus plexippus plexippus]